MILVSNSKQENDIKTTATPRKNAKRHFHMIKMPSTLTVIRNDDNGGDDDGGGGT